MLEMCTIAACSCSDNSFNALCYHYCITSVFVVAFSNKYLFTCLLIQQRKKQIFLVT